jgi:hypothetical protein
MMTQRLFDITDFEHRKMSCLHLYVRPMDNAIMEAVVLDNELAVYHTSVKM